ncbi:MAG: hypothetical protein FD149_2566 [Rhodospirillaceae bacterium]|nr:MAG: hypothetical protein FD149_2566 [Rhodospirillaceae bacterium]
MANVLGAGMAADAFFAAFKLPNLFRRLFAEGAFTAAFVPLYASALETDGNREADSFAARALSVLAVVLLAVLGLAEAMMPWIMELFTPGFGAVPGKMDLAVTLARITFPYLLFISVVSLLAGVLNSLNRFASAAATPILLNMSMIAFLLAGAPFMESPAHALALGVSVAGVLQLLWLAVACARAGVCLTPAWPRWDDRVRLLVRRIVPAAFGAGLYHINLVIDTIFASLIFDGAVSFLYYADRVSQLPLGVVGVAVGTALLPLMSRQLRAGDEKGAIASQNRAMEFALLLTVPAAAALVVLAEPIIAVLFERGAFGASQTHATAGALAAFALGLPAYVLTKALTPGFFARYDTATPVKVAAAGLVLNVLLSLALMGPLAHVGLALSSALSAWFNVTALWMILSRRGQGRLDDRLKTRVPRLIAISLVLGGVLAAGQRGVAFWLGETLWMRIGAMTILVVGGLMVFAGLASLSGVARLSDLKGLRGGGETSQGG